MKIAILDLGTNTFNLFIAELLPSPKESGLLQTASGQAGFTKLYKSKIAVKLGEGGINRNLIEERPFKRGIRALQKHKATIDKYGAEQIIALATSGIRSATNGKEFLQKAKKKTGINITIISGDREAELIYYGVRSAVKMTNQLSLIMDIGGGSTEFIIANGEKIFWKQSFLLGAARILEKFNPHDPIKEEEVKNLENYLEQELHPLFEAVRQFPVIELLGSSGSFDSLAAMISYRYHTIEDFKGRTEYIFHLPDCYEIYKVILKSSTEERKNMDGLIKMRVDMIVVSAVFVNFIIQKLKINKMRLSRYSLKEGVLWEVLNT